MEDSQPKVLNRAFYGVTDAYINNANPATKGKANYVSFQNYTSKYGTMQSSPFGSGTRNIQLTGKILF